MPDLLLLLLVALLGTALLWGLLRLAFPRSSSRHQDHRTLETLHEAYRWTPLQHFGWVLLWTLLGGVLAVGLFEALEALFWSGAHARSTFWVGPDRAARALVGVLGGAAFGLLLGLRSMRRHLGDAYSGYMDYQNRITGLANERATRAFAVLLGLMWAVLSIGFLHWSSAFSAQDLHQRPLFSLQTRHYPFAEIEELQTLAHFVRPDGRLCTLEHYRIRFADGSRWDSRNSGFENPVRNRALFAWLSEQTGLPLVEVVPEGRVPADGSADDAPQGAGSE